MSETSLTFLGNTIPQETSVPLALRLFPFCLLLCSLCLGAGILNTGIAVASKASGPMLLSRKFPFYLDWLL